MKELGTIILIVLGGIKIISGLEDAGKHGMPKEGKYNARIEVLETLVGVLFILIALEIL
jgi:putative Mn2+ efflux pump MntP